MMREREEGRGEARRADVGHGRSRKVGGASTSSAATGLCSTPLGTTKKSPSCRSMSLSLPSCSRTLMIRLPYTIARKAHTTHAP
jgi:hypothetical protein